MKRLLVASSLLALEALHISAYAQERGFGERVTAEIQRRIPNAAKFEHVATARNGDTVRVYYRFNDVMAGAICYPRVDGDGFACEGPPSANVAARGFVLAK